ncbi:NF038130 family PEP-CTERM protein [Nostoc sp. FACHB-87]|uniref:NF038130 family PEP-CTERM protein n=1 Tax=Nostocales TaxID=1161 RepID=UPI001689E4CC|nr:MULTISPECIES: NF038130 family PEP-CTERM protein [Nostocales]MBD2297808.1 NF038130 family PEP-CTERM protein [Nostoc sp. FACHB-190]MBD2454863.1 NF038130 family PEP-CTERM protein [Nostoc sp. FACHB-87]MBD2476679.1 NF038130 family PEP-CTERM protein [Anabaena sp. FACHB-83]MBD2487571.1 NF038130 family PEP-CTERM protein [Aulosira sp. FACHB-615]
MKRTLKTLVIGASMAVGVSAIASNPAQAGVLTNATITGNDYIKYNVNGTNTEEAPGADLATILTGDSSSPTGNVELFASSEKAPLFTTSTNTTQRVLALRNFFNYNQVTTLSGEINGKQISLSSLTATDWFGASSVQAVTGAATNTLLNNAINGLYNSSNLATQWFNTTLSTYGVTANQTLFNTFLLAGGFQRFSDPNISYVNQNDTTGEIKIGLAGHLNAATLLGLNPENKIQVSELVKVSYNGGPSEILYSYKASDSGLISKDGTKSHNGNYEVTIQGIPVPTPEPTAVPEPSVVLGILGVAGIVATQRKLKKVSG